ncbi:O-6-alkylguanine-DNA alkyltransferase [Halictus rubicundus]|uniref:O-6-alkylguanine-DNA alkyltransferase n=1 Tax=Halictus rubicundus TaxID=77578 RepID=UPI004036A7E4
MIRSRIMTQDEYKQDHANFKIIYGFHSSPFGDCLLGMTNTDKAIAFLAFVNDGSDKAFTELKNDWPLSELVEDNDNETAQVVQAIFSPRAGSNDSLTLLLMGTEFQIKVWQCLLCIPKATTITYQQVASDINNPKAVRAVGNAVMKNKVAYLVPCHRVKGKSGSNKYKWGSKLKEAIVSYEIQGN